MLGIATLLGTLMHIAPEAKGTLPDALNFLKIFSKGLFTFLVILVGYNAQKAFGGTGVNGAIIAALFILGYNPSATVGYYSGLQDFLVSLSTRAEISSACCWQHGPERRSSAL